MKEVSVIALAKNLRELEPLRKALARQTFRDYEFVTSTKKGIPQAMNDAISKANGSIIVVTESDAMPMTNTWLEEMVKAVKENNKGDPRKKTLVRGIEVSSLPWCWCNLACYSSVLKDNCINERYPMAEDTELFARLKKLGYSGVELPIAPVLHERRNRGVWKSMKNSFTYGRLLANINLKYGDVGFSSKKKEGGSIIAREFGIIFSRISFMLGILIGFIFRRG
jgi:hypothetical protein